MRKIKNSCKIILALYRAAVYYGFTVNQQKEVMKNYKIKITGFDLTQISEGFAFPNAEATEAALIRKGIAASPKVVSLNSKGGFNLKRDAIMVAAQIEAAQNRGHGARLACGELAYSNNIKIVRA